MSKALKQKQEYGIPLSRYTVFLQNCPLGHDPKDKGFFELSVPQAEREVSFGCEEHFVREVSLRVDMGNT